MNLIFDLDGTLLYTLEDLRAAVNFALEQFEFPKRDIDEIRRAVGDGLKMLMIRSLPRNVSTDFAEKALVLMKGYYKAHCMDQTRPYDGIIEMLRCLKMRGHNISIVSNKAHELVQVLRERYFGDLVDLALGESEEHAKKPSPDMIRNCIDAIGCDAVYIGDSEVDILTARNAQIPCVCVTWGYRSKEFLQENGAINFVDSPADLLEMI